MPTKPTKLRLRTALAAHPGAPADAARQFLELYYPIHYQAGIRVEDAMRGGELSRHQVAILWLVRAEGEGGRRMNRKAIERSLGSWFEISGAAITKALRSMSRPPHKLVELLRAHPRHRANAGVNALTWSGVLTKSPALQGRN